MRATDRTAAHPRALVLLTETFADGGIQRFNRTFLSACDRIGVPCDVLSLGDGEDLRTRWNPPPSVAIRVFNRNKARFAAAVAAALLRGGYQFVVIGHINLLELVAAVTLVRRAARTRIVLIAHGIEVWTGMGTRRRRSAIHMVDRVLSVSRYTRDMIKLQVPELPEDRFALFPNALSQTWVGRFPPQELRDVRMTLPQRFLLSVTRLDRGDRYKGIVTVIEALAMLADTFMHYVIAGRGEDREFLRGVAQRFGLRDRVHFIGGVSDAELENLYRQCSAFVLPSGKEGFGIVFLEAMFFGAPVIAADAKGAVDVVRNEETGLAIPYGDTVALAAAIERLCADSALRDRLRQAGRAGVVGDGPFTFQAYVARLAATFEIPVPPPPEANPNTAAVN